MTEQEKILTRLFTDLEDLLRNDGRLTEAAKRRDEAHDLWLMTGDLAKRAVEKHELKALALLKKVIDRGRLEVKNEA